MADKKNTKIEKKGCFFAQQISGDKAMESRVQTTTNLAKQAWDGIILSLKNAITKKENEIQNMLDLGSDSSISLRPVPKDWCAESWAKRLHEADCTLNTYKEQLTIAEARYEMLFGENTTTEE